MDCRRHGGGLLAVGTLGFRPIGHSPRFRAFYRTLMTVSTIAAEPEDQPSHAGRIFNVVLIFSGIGVIGYAIGMLTHAMIESDLSRFFGRRRMEREIAHARNHFAICSAD